MRWSTATVGGTPATINAGQARECSPIATTPTPHSVRRSSELSGLILANTFRRGLKDPKSTEQTKISADKRALVYELSSTVAFFTPATPATWTFQSGILSRYICSCAPHMQDQAAKMEAALLSGLTLPLVTTASSRRGARGQLF